PAFISVIARVKPVRLTLSEPPPTLSVAIAVHNEVAVIADRVADAYAQEESGARILEVLVGIDGSTDQTAAVVRQLALEEPRLRLIDLPRVGQTATQNALFEAAVGDVVVLTDAETRFRPRCLVVMAEALRDPRVGCATGRVEWCNQNATATSTNEGLYWRYERRVRLLERRVSFLTADT